MAGASWGWGVRPFLAWGPRAVNTGRDHAILTPMKAIIVVLVVLLVVVGGLFMWGVGGNNRLRGSRQGGNAPRAPAQPRDTAARGRGAGRQRRVGPGADRVPAARRPDPEPRRDSEGLRRPGAHGARGSHEGARERVPDDPHAGDAERPQRAPEVPGGAEPAGRRAVAAARDRRALPRPQVEPELPRPAETARGDGEPDRGRAPPLQRGGAGLQPPDPPLPRQPGGRLPRLQGESVLRGRPGQRDRPQGQVLAVDPRRLRCA